MHSESNRIKQPSGATQSPCINNKKKLLRLSQSSLFIRRRRRTSRRSSSSSSSIMRTKTMTMMTLFLYFLLVILLVVTLPSSSPSSYCNAADTNADSSSSDNNNESTTTTTTKQKRTCKNNKKNSVFNKDENNNNVCGDEDEDDSNSDSYSSNNKKCRRRRRRKHVVKNKCKLYMAPSSIPGGGYGLFTSRDLKKGQSILGNWNNNNNNNNNNERTATVENYDSLLDGPNIPVLIDITKQNSSTIGCVDDDNSDNSNNSDNNNNNSNNYCNNPLKLFNNVWWSKNGGMSDRMWREIDSRQSSSHRQMDILDYQITFGSLPNFHPYRSNIDFKQPSDNNNGMVYDDYTYLNVNNDKTTSSTNNNNNNNNNPLKGSFSYYKGKQFMVNSNVKAGEELFLNYGDNFFYTDSNSNSNDSNSNSNSNSDSSYKNKIPRRNDYYSAGVIIRKFLIKGSYIRKQSIDLIGYTTDTDTDCESNDSDINDSESSDKNNNIANMREITTDVLKSIETFIELLSFEYNGENGYRDYYESTDDDDDDDDSYNDSNANEYYDDDDDDDDDDEDNKAAIDQIDSVMIRILSLVPTDEPTLFKVIDKAIKNRRQRLGFNEYDYDPIKSKRENNQNELLLKQLETKHKNNPIPSIKDFANAIYTDFSLLPPKKSKELKRHGMCLDHIISGISKTPIIVLVDDINSNNNTDTSTSTSTSSTTASTSTTTTIGRGAIAQRLIKKDDMIVPVPLLHLLDRSLLKNNNKDELLISYCFGHHESTMIFCPITNSILINHCSSSANSTSTGTGSDGDNNENNKVLFPCGGDNNKNNKEGPNAMYRWASSSSELEGSESRSSSSLGWDPQTDKTLKMTINEIAIESNKESTHRLLSMEIIALRDIKPGEEIFIDYGKEWENAWLEHVEAWNSNSTNDDDNTNTDNSIPITTEYEMNQQKDIPISLWFGGNNVANVLRHDRPATSLNGRYQAMCWYKNRLPIHLELGYYHSWNPNHRNYWKQLSDAEIYEYALDAKNIFNMNKKNDDDHEYADDDEYDDDEYDDDDYDEYGQGGYGNFWPCSVLAKEENVENNINNNKYTVRIYPSEYHHGHFPLAKHLLIKNYPRESIRFFTLPNKGDQHLSNAFRHHIEIRDEIFPNQWKNLKIRDENEKEEQLQEQYDDAIYGYYDL